MYMPYSSSTSPACRSRLATAQTSTTGPPSGGARLSPKSTTRAIENGRLEVHEVVGDPERIQRALAHLVQVQVVALLRIGVLGEHERLHAGRADRVVDDAAELAELVEVVELGEVHDRAVVDERPGTSRARSTLKPVALATIVCSKLILEPSANDVTMAGFCSQRSAHACCVVGLRYGSWRPLTLQTTRGIRPEPGDPAHEVHLQAGLVAVAGRQRHAGPLGVGLQDRADRRVDLGVHHHDVLAVGERLDEHVGAELDRAGHVDDDVDLRRPADQHRVLGDRRPAGGERRRRGRSGCRPGRRPRGPSSGRRLGPLGLAVVDRRHPHAGDAVGDLVGEALAHEAGADHADPDRPVLPPPGPSARCRR